MQKTDGATLALIGSFIVIGLLSSAWIFLVRKDYDFVIESPCDPETQNCYLRDCDNDGCPVNGYSSYRVFRIDAAAFARCASDSCALACASGQERCEEIACGSDESDACSVAAEE